ncbi:MAG TPA: hypothetical protein VGC63_10250 [Solirubrobacterales bacterium]|jgi:hypothetical protein
MIAKAVVTALSFQTTDFPKAAAGQPSNETFTYFDQDTERDPRAVTVAVERGIPADQRPAQFTPCLAVFQVEEVDRTVKRQDREDAGRTYDATTKQHKLKVLAFEPPPKGAEKSQQSKVPIPDQSAKAAA